MFDQRQTIDQHRVPKPTVSGDSEGNLAFDEFKPIALRVSGIDHSESPGRRLRELRFGFKADAEFRQSLVVGLEIVNVEAEVRCTQLMLTEMARRCWWNDVVDEFQQVLLPREAEEHQRTFGIGNPRVISARWGDRFDLANHLKAQDFAVEVLHRDGVANNDSGMVKSCDHQLALSARTTRTRPTTIVNRAKQLISIAETQGISGKIFYRLPSSPKRGGRRLATPATEALNTLFPGRAISFLTTRLLGQAA